MIPTQRAFYLVFHVTLLQCPQTVQGFGIQEWSSTRGNSALEETSDNIWRHFWLSQMRDSGTTGMQWGEARDGAEHPIMHRTAPTIKNCLA